MLIKRLIQTFLYSLKTKGVMKEEVYEKVQPIGSHPARIYGLPKLRLN